MITIHFNYVVPTIITLKKKISNLDFLSFNSNYEIWFINDCLVFTIKSTYKYPPAV